VAIVRHSVSNVGVGTREVWKSVLKRAPGWLVHHSSLQLGFEMNAPDGLFAHDPAVDSVFDAIRKDYAAMGLLKYADVEDPLNILTVDTTDRLDPSPSADERAFWGSSKGIDGWQPDFTRHPYPHWFVDVADTPYGDKLDGPGYAFLRGRVANADIPTWRFYASNMTPNESSRLKYRMDRLCPVKELKVIAENCMSTREAKADPNHCWLERSLFVKCNEFKKQYLNNRQRLIYIYGSIKDDLREWDEEDPTGSNDPGLSSDRLYVYRWEFYKMQYREGKRNIFMRQMEAHKADQQISLWKRLMSPSMWFTTPAPPAHAPRHVKNYVYQGNHWLTPGDITRGPPMPEDIRAQTIWSLPDDYLSEEDVNAIVGRSQPDPSEEDED